MVGLVLWGTVSSGCKPTDSATAPPVDAVAIVGSAPIARAVFTNALAKAGAGATKEKVLGELAREAALVEKARQTGFDRDPSVVAAVQRLIAARYEEVALAPRLEAARKIDEARVQAAYETNAAKFTTPARFRAGVLYLRTSPKATPDKRAEVRRRAESLRTQASQSDTPSFARLVQQHSDDQATRYAGGDSGWVAAEGATGRWEPPVLAAMRALTEPGQVTPVIETTNGFYFARLTESQAASRKPLKDVAEGLRYQIVRQQEQAARDTLHAELQKEFPVRIQTSVWDTVTAPAASHPAQSAPPALPR